MGLSLSHQAGVVLAPASQAGAGRTQYAVLGRAAAGGMGWVWGYQGGYFTDTSYLYRTRTVLCLATFRTSVRPSYEYSRPEPCKKYSRPASTVVATGARLLWPDAVFVPKDAERLLKPAE